jgi:hypothetical protein
LRDRPEVLAMLAAGAALAELRQEAVEGGGIHAAERQIPQRRVDLVLDEAAVADLPVSGSRPV